MIRKVTEPPRAINRTSASAEELLLSNGHRTLREANIIPTKKANTVLE